MPLGFVDLFCGAGGFTQGLRDAGLEHLGGVDLEKHACSTYGANHGAVLRADVRSLDAASILRLTGGRRPDVLAASPPCQSVSTVGKTPRAPHENDQLFSEAIRLAAELGCSFVVIENVAGFSSKLGEGGLALADVAARQLEVRAVPRSPTEAELTPRGRRRRGTVRRRGSWTQQTMGCLSGGGGRSSWQQRLLSSSDGPRLHPPGRPDSVSLP